MTDDVTNGGTHGHISFRLDLRRMPHEFWMLLGEAQSKIEHIAGTPITPDLARELHQVYLAKGALATTAIEGNTLSEEEALRRVEHRLQLPPSREYLGREIDNIVAATNAVFLMLSSGQSGDLSCDGILELNRLVLEGLEVDKGVSPGQLRPFDVTVGKYRAVAANQCTPLLKKMCDWLNGPDFAPAPGQEIAFSIIRAVISHLYLVWIHPFGDGNGRTARLVEFQILVGAGVPSPAAHLLSNHYNLTRTDYYRRLQESSQLPDGPQRFLMYAVRGYVDGLKEQIDRIRSQELDAAWRNWVHESLSESDAATVRRRRLVLDISILTQPVAQTAAADVSPRIARAYTGASRRTLARDIEWLIEQGYLLRTPDGLVANKGLMLSLLPSRVRAERQ